MTGRSFPMLLAVLALVSAVSCSSLSGELERTGYAGESGPPAPMVEDAGRDDGPPPDPRTAFEFEIQALHTGAVVDGTQLFDDAPAIITFVDPECAICHEEGPALARAAAANPHINYVVVHGFGYPDAYLDFVEEARLHQENVLHLVDDDGALLRAFGLTVQPASVLVTNRRQLVTADGALGDDGFATARQIVAS